LYVGRFYRWRNNLEPGFRPMNETISVVNDDILNFSCDVLVLKYAQAFYGADGPVARILKPEAWRKDISPLPGEYVLLPSQKKLAAKSVLFVGVAPLAHFDYEEIREFASQSMKILSKEMPEATQIAMTMHGVGYGLDEKESFSAQVAGLLDAFRLEASPFGPRQITIVDRNRERAERIKNILEEILPSNHSLGAQLSVSETPPQIISAGKESKNKPHVFVAMPFGKDMEDVFRYGIQGPVNEAGLLCERVDMTTFTGDILARIKSRIETATLVIADLTGANPNVYLEVGYAWGKDRSTLLLSKSAELEFDVRGQRTIIYETISDLEKQLKADLANL
jgi:hypothetical protein